MEYKIWTEESTMRLEYSICLVNKKKSNKTKITVFNKFYRANGCESWVILRKIKNKIQALEIKYLRRVTGAQRWTEWCNREELGTKSVLEFIELMGTSSEIERHEAGKKVYRKWVGCCNREDVTMNEAKLWVWDKKHWTKFVHG